MRAFSRSKFAAAAIAIVMAFPAAAEVTPRQVSDALQGYYRSFGYTFTVASEDLSGNALTLNDVSLSYAIPDTKSEMTVNIGWIKLTDTGDGSVRMTMSKTSNFDIALARKNKDIIRILAHVGLDGFSTLISGDIAAMTLDSKAAATTFVIDKISTPKGTVDANVTVSAADFTSRYSIKTLAGNARKIDGKFGAGTIEIKVNATEPTGDGVFTMNNEIASVAGAFAGTMPEKIDMKNILGSGTSYDASYDMGKSAIDLSYKSVKDQFSVTGGAQGANLATKISPDKLSYGFSQKGVDLTVSSSKLPVQNVNVTYDTLEFGVGMPLKKSNKPADFHLKTALRGLAVSENVWSMFDPGKVLPRDPATIAIDLDGTAIITANLTDPDSLKDLRGPPALPLSIDLNDLTVSVAGALLKGSGAVRFDPDRILTPIGAVILRLKGGFGLMDKLVQIGLLPENTSMGFRAMLGAFTKPVGDDELETKIKMTKDGRIMANGQRVK